MESSGLLAFSRSLLICDTLPLLLASTIANADTMFLPTAFASLVLISDATARSPFVHLTTSKRLEAAFHAPRRMSPSEADVIRNLAPTASSFEGNLPYNLFSDAPVNGDGCVESNFVGTGSILSLVPMAEPNTFCEGDIVDPPPPGWPLNKTLYTKIELSCATDGSEDVGVKFYDCEGNSDCSRCTPFHIAAGTTNLGNFTAARANLNECFYGWPSIPLDPNAMLPVIGYQSFDETMGATQVNDDVFYDVLFDHSCMASMIVGDADGGGDDTTSAAISMKNNSFRVVGGGIFLSLVVFLS